MSETEHGKRGKHLLHAARGAERVHQESTQLQVYTLFNIASKVKVFVPLQDLSLKGSPCEPETAYRHHMPG